MSADTANRQRATLQTLMTIASHGGRFYSGDVFGGESLRGYVAGWSESVRNAVCESYAEACQESAFFIEAADCGGYRIARLGGGPSKTGHRYSGEVFRTYADLWSAMRTADDLRAHPACAVDREIPLVGKARSIVIVGRRWFDAKNGNTYHTSEVIIDGVRAWQSPVTYGYDDSYIETAADWLEEFAPPVVMRMRYANGAKQGLRGACEVAGILLVCSRVDVRIKADLTK